MTEKDGGAGIPASQATPHSKGRMKWSLWQWIMYALYMTWNLLRSCTIMSRLRAVFDREGRPVLRRPAPQYAIGPEHIKLGLLRVHEDKSGGHGAGRVACREEDGHGQMSVLSCNSANGTNRSDRSRRSCMNRVKKRVTSMKRRS